MSSECRIFSNTIIGKPLKSNVSTDPIITLDQAKMWLKMDGITADDDVIQEIIDGAIDWAERYTATSLRACTITAILEIHNRIELPYGPVTSITSVDGVLFADVPACRFTGPSIGFPLLNGYGVYTVIYEAGYTTIPPAFILGIKQFISFAYEHRGDSYESNQAVFAQIARAQLRQFKRNIGV